MTFKMNRKEIILSGVLVIFYTVGIVGTHISAYKDSFFSLSYFNLLLSFVILILARNDKNKAFWGFLGFAFFTGMLVEWIGVHTGLLFGEYSYGKNLGYKVFDVPLVIGINWAMLTVVSSSVVSLINSNNLIKLVLSAILMTLFDALMEPVAIRSDFWSWDSGVIPFYNYVSWFLISFILQSVYFRFKLVEVNKVHNLLFLCMIIFFVSLILF
jgi:putative membrane protein